MKPSNEFTLTYIHLDLLHTSHKSRLPKTCHTYPAMMKLGTVITYLKKIQKLNKSRETPLDFC